MTGTHWDLFVIPAKAPMNAGSTTGIQSACRPVKSKSLNLGEIQQVFLFLVSCPSLPTKSHTNSLLISYPQADYANGIGVRGSYCNLSVVV
jgi:hypothetical protein